MRYWTTLATVALIVNIIFLTAYLNVCNHNSKPFLLRSRSNELYDQFEYEEEVDGALLDLPEFKYLISKSECNFDISDDIIPYFIIAVNSNPLNKEMRQTIRESWGSFAKYVQIFFFLGDAESGEIQRQIEMEDQEFSDIIQGNFVDCQHNLAYKHVMMLKWFTETCDTSKYLAKVDDDVFVNIPAIYDFLSENRNTSDFLMGDYHKPSKCPRNGTWAVTYEEYPSSFYPAYATRHSIIYSRDVVNKLFKESHLVKYFWVEDVFVTGILRIQTNIDISPISKYILTNESLSDMREKTINLPSPANFIFSMPQMTIHDQILLWERTEWYRMGETGESENQTE